MTHVHTNGTSPAFPIVYFGDDSTRDGNGGLTKRELFAAMAMQGILAAEDPRDIWSPKGLADLAIERADALLSALYPQSDEHSLPIGDQS